jgi:hypothetical protein
VRGARGSGCRSGPASTGLAKAADDLRKRLQRDWGGAVIKAARAVYEKHPLRQCEALMLCEGSKLRVEISGNDLSDMEGFGEA